MVKEALHERANLLQIAPHLSFPLPIMLPVYRWWQVGKQVALFILKSFFIMDLFVTGTLFLRRH